MATIKSIEDAIKADWNWLRAMIATNQTVSMGVVAVGCVILGRFGFPWIV